MLTQRQYEVRSFIHAKLWESANRVRIQGRMVGLVRRY